MRIFNTALCEPNANAFLSTVLDQARKACRRTNRLRGTPSSGSVSYRKGRVPLTSVTALLMTLGAQSAGAQDACIDPSTLTATTVSITRYFTDGEKAGRSFDGYRATAWFYGNTRYLVSI